MKKVMCMVSCLLCIVMIMNMIPLSAFAMEAAEPTGDLVEEIVYEPMTDEELNEFSPYVNVEKAKELGHVMRLEEEETLNSLVFLNTDGSKSRYCFSSDIKYVNENGDFVLIDSSTDLASIPSVLAYENKSDIEKTIVYTNIDQPRYTDSEYKVGEVDDTHGNGYMLVRFNGFCDNGAYVDLDSEQIIDVSFFVYANEHPKYTLMACPYMGTDWEVETATCNNTSQSHSPLYASFATYTNIYIFTFDLTEMAKSWVTGEYDGHKGMYIYTFAYDNEATSTTDYIGVTGTSSYVVTYAEYTTELFTDTGAQLGYGETEPNNSKTTANIAVTKDGTTRQANSVIRGCIENKGTGDVDWYAVYLKSGQMVDIKLYNINYSADLDMTVYRIGGGSITSDNNTDGMAEYITYEASSDGWCYIKIYGNPDYDSSYSLYIKRDIRVSGKGFFTSSQSLYVTEPNNEEYMRRLGQDVADADCQIMFLGFGSTAVQGSSSSAGEVVYGCSITHSKKINNNWIYGSYFYSFAQMKDCVRKFVKGYDANSSHKSIDELAIMLSSAGTEIYDENDDMIWDNVHLGEAFGEAIQELNNELDSDSKVKKIVAGFNFEIGQTYHMTYTECSDIERGYASSFDNLSECLPMYVVADITGGLTSSSQITSEDYSFDRGWMASEVFDVCAGYDFLRCIPQISLSNRIDRWMILYEWSAQEYWDYHSIGKGNRLIDIKPLKMYGIDCTNSFNDGKDYNTNTVEKAMNDFISRYYALDSNMTSYFNYSTWMSMHEYAQLNWTPPKEEEE